MGAFLYARAAVDADPALASLAAKQLELADTVEGDGFRLFVFRKRFVREAQQVLRLPGGDFVAAVGTLFYRRKSGADALRLLYEDFGAAEIFPDALGSYAVLLRKNGVLSCFNDYFGTYQLYADAEARVVSSSLLAVARTLPQVQVSAQALYEYVFDAAGYGTETLVRGVARLDPAEIHSLHPRWQSVRKRCSFAGAEPPARFADQVDAANAELVAYFQTLHANAGERLLLGLSGGYDSRLLLAAALKAGAAPRLFVGGPAGASDVRIARLLAAQAGLPLEHLDTEGLPRTPVERFPDLVREKLDYYDGVGIRGAVNDGEEYLWRCRRMGGGLVELNGGGGEIFRDFWKLGNRRIAVRDFVDKVMAFKNLDKIAATTERFSREHYSQSLEAKIKASLGSGSDFLGPEQVASLYTLLRSVAFAAPSNKEMNLLSYSLLPFAEPRLSIPSYRVPLAHKIHGRFEAEMIRRLSPALAAVPTSYGHRFSEPLPLKQRLKESIDRHCRSLLPLPVLFFAYRRLRKQSQYNNAAHYYSEPYLRALVDPKKLWISEYFDVEKLFALADPFVVSRALSAELMFDQLGKRGQSNFPVTPAEHVRARARVTGKLL